MLRLLARGMRAADGRDLDSAVAIRVLDAILADAELSARLDRLEEDSVRAEFLALYESEATRER